MATQPNGRTKVFISYSHKDVKWLQRLRVHLRPLEREHRIETWDDTRIKPGSRWREEIQEALAAAKVAVVLVSADFLASDFIATDELPPLLSAAEKDGAVILPVILSPSRFLRTTSLAQFQAVNDPSKPLIGMAKGGQEAVLVKVSEAIEASLNRSPETVTEQRRKDETTRLDEPEGLKKSDTGEPTEAETQTLNESRRSILPKLHPTVWVAIITGVVALVTAYWQFVHKPRYSDSTVQYTGRITDQASQQVIRGAKVSIETQGVPQVHYTDSDGIFNLQLGSPGDAIRIRVEAGGYEPFDRNVSLSGKRIEDVRLTPINAPAQPSPTITPGISMSKDENKLSPNRKSTPAGRPGVGSASDLEERRRRAREDLNYRNPTPEP